MFSFDISKNSTPNDFVNALIEASHEYTEIELNFNTKGSAFITQDNIGILAIFIKDMLPKNANVRFKNLTNLSEKEALILLSNESFIDTVSDSSFAKLITLFEKTTELTLSQEYLRKKLNAIALQKNQQSFIASCVAKSIQMILQENNLLKEHENTRSKELEIYQQIWSAPGSIASPDKIIAFFKEKKYLSKSAETKSSVESKTHNLNIKAIEISDITMVQLVIEQEDKHSMSTSAYSLFKKSVHKEDLLELETKELNEKHFPRGSTAILIQNNGEGLLHALFVKCNKDGSLEVTNPQFGTNTVYKTFTDYIANDNYFMGVGFCVASDSENTRKLI